MVDHTVPRFVELAFGKLQPFDRCPLCESKAPACFYLRESNSTRYFIDPKDDSRTIISDQILHFSCRTQSIQIVQKVEANRRLVTSSCQVERNGSLYIAVIDFAQNNTSFRKTRAKHEDGYQFSVTGCRKRLFLSESVDEWCDSLDRFFNFA
jgi:hypothetical protein